RVAVTRGFERNQVAAWIETRVRKWRSAKKAFFARDKHPILLAVALSKNLSASRLRGQRQPRVSSNERGVMPGIVLEKECFVRDWGRRGALALGRERAGPIQVREPAVRGRAFGVVAEGFRIKLDQLREHERRFAFGVGNPIFELPRRSLSFDRLPTFDF